MYTDSCIVLGAIYPSWLAYVRLVHTLQHPASLPQSMHATDCLLAALGSTSGQAAASMAWTLLMARQPCTKAWLLCRSTAAQLLLLHLCTA